MINDQGNKTNALLSNLIILDTADWPIELPYLTNFSKYNKWNKDVCSL